MKKFLIKVNDKSYEVEVEEIDESGKVVVTPQLQPTTKIEQKEQSPAIPKIPEKPVVMESNVSAPAGSRKITAPMPGNIINVKVKPGDKVSKGDVLVVLEAMKMENEIKAQAAGEVVAVAVQKGASVNSGDLLVAIS